MPPRCSLCSHPDRKAVDAAIVAGASCRDIAGRFGTTRSAVDRHKAHIAPKVAKAAEKEGRTLAGILAEAHRRVAIIAKRNMAAKNDDVALRALKEMRELAALEFGTKSSSKVEQTVKTVEPATKEERREALLRLKEEVEQELDGKGTMQ